MSLTSIPSLLAIVAVVGFVLIQTIFSFMA
jgi:hypothetical protein